MAAETRVIDPEHLGKGKGIHWLTHEKENLHRIVGRDRLGLPVEAKVCRMRSEVMCDADGNEVDIPIDNGRVPSRLSYEKYGRPHRETMILEHGFLPRAECPYTPRYGRPLAEVPDGVEPCAGKPDGCLHYREIRAERAVIAKAKAKERKSVAGAFSESQARQFVATMSTLAGAWNDQAADAATTAPPATRARGRKMVDEAGEK
jgi:hypothetical protein